MMRKLQKGIVLVNSLRYWVTWVTHSFVLLQGSFAVTQRTKSSIFLTILEVLVPVFNLFNKSEEFFRSARCAAQAPRGG